MSITQCRLFSMAQWLRMIGPRKTCQQDQGGDVETCLPLDLVGPRAWPGGFAEALDDDDAFQAGPIVAVLQPGDVVNDGGGSGLDAAVIAVDCLIAADLGVLEPLGLLLGHEDLDILAERALVALQGQDVIGFLVDDLLRNLALTP